MKYKLNLHAHSKYSDGSSTIEQLAREYRDQDFTCAVITDHHYTRFEKHKDVEELCPFHMSKESWLKAVEEAKVISEELNYPIIVGVEWGFFDCEEVLCFGFDFVNELLDGVETIDDFIKLKEKHNGLAIIAHPSCEKLLEIKGERALDGMEIYNSGQPFFWVNNEIPETMKHLLRFSNSDAHHKSSLDRGYNIVEEAIISEKELIAYCKAKKPIEHYALCMEAQSQFSFIKS